MPHELPVLRELALLAGCSLAIILLFRRLRMPPVVGFIVTGILIGPRRLRAGPRPADDLDAGRDRRRAAAVHGRARVLARRPAAARRALARRGRSSRSRSRRRSSRPRCCSPDCDPARAMFLGLLVSLSSTALVLKLLTDRVELQSPHGRCHVGVLLFQDLAVVPIACSTPALGALGERRQAPAISGSARAARARARPDRRSCCWRSVVARRPSRGCSGARRARARARRSCRHPAGRARLGVPRRAAGLSLALGAFLAGLMLAESRAALADRSPTCCRSATRWRACSSSRSACAVDPRAVAAAPAGRAERHGRAGRSSSCSRPRWRCALAGHPWRIAFAAALGAGADRRVLVRARAGRPPARAAGRRRGSQAFFAGAVFSLLLTPLVVARAPAWALRFELRVAARAAATPRIPGVAAADAAQSSLLRDHVVIAGFGLNGQNVARVLRAMRIPHVVVDLDPDAVARCARGGQPACWSATSRNARSSARPACRARGWWCSR